jgi:hypothetical protein
MIANGSATGTNYIHSDANNTIDANLLNTISSGNGTNQLTTTTGFNKLTATGSGGVGHNEITVASGNNLIASTSGFNLIRAPNNLIVGNIIQQTVTTESTSTGTGALQILGGAGIARNLNVGGLLTVSGTSTLAVTTITGGLVVTGGSLNVGGITTLSTTLLTPTFANSAPHIPIASGGPAAVTPVRIGSTQDYYMAFTTVGAYTVTFSSPTLCEVLIIGGGGGGGLDTGGGGGAGEVEFFTNRVVSYQNGFAPTFNGAYTFTVGGGGAAGASVNAAGSNGSASTIAIQSGATIITAGGGAGGGSRNTVGSSALGGGGGGGGGAVYAGGTSTGIGGAGGSSHNATPTKSGGGGGGGTGFAGGQGQATVGGTSGSGVNIDLSTSGAIVAQYGGGGGGGAFDVGSTVSTGTFGGGSGGTNTIAATAGTANTGGGGGGGGNTVTGGGGAGGSGLIVIRFTLEALTVSGLTELNNTNVIGSLSIVGTTYSTATGTLSLSTSTGSLVVNGEGKITGGSTIGGRLNVIGGSSIGGGILIRHNETNATSIPLIGNVINAPAPYEIAASSQFGGDGFLRLRAGFNGGTGVTSHTSFIDLCGYKGVAAEDRIIRFGTNSIERMRIDVNGDVIMTNNLYLGNNTTDNTVTKSIFFGGLSGDNGYNFCVIENRIWGASDQTELLLYKGNDNDGGNNNVLDRIRLRSGQIVFDTIEADTARTLTNTKMLILSNGNVGMGTLAPVSRLQVSGTVTATTFNALSDRRIKVNITDIDFRSLDIIRQIRPREYKYIDYKCKDSVYGFVAQEIKELIPKSVELVTEFIPSVYENAFVDGNKITLLNKSTSDISLCKLKLCNKCNSDIIVDITSIDDIKTFTIDIDISNNIFCMDICGNTLDEYTKDGVTTYKRGSQVYTGEVKKGIFVYGPQVDDFHVINKDTIWTVTLSATKEIDAELQEAKSRILAQDIRIAELEQTVQRQQADIDEIKRRLG